MADARVRCPNPECHMILSVPVESQGQRVRCAACGESFLTPLTGIRNRLRKKRPGAASGAGRSRTD